MVCFFSSRKALLALLASWFFWLQCTTLAYCIYNSMGDDTKLYVEDADRNDVSFKKLLDTNGSKECCFYRNSDCNPSGDQWHDVLFNVNFKFNPGAPEEHLSPIQQVNCTAGGALAFYGTMTNYWAICTAPDGKSERKVVNDLIRPT